MLICRKLISREYFLSFVKQLMTIYQNRHTDEPTQTQLELRSFCGSWVIMQIVSIQNERLS